MQTGKAKTDYYIETMTRIIIADDHRLFLDGMAAMLDQFDGVKLVGTASNGEQVLELLRQKTCDIVLMDISMPVVNGLVAAQRISQEFPQVKVALVSVNVTPEYVKEALRSGVWAYILKDANREELYKMIQMLADGKKYFGEAVILNLAYEYMPETATSHVSLTARERQVLELMAQEFTAPEIAQKLYISKDTVETHKRNMLKKLGLKNSYALVKYAIQHGLV